MKKFFFTILATLFCSDLFAQQPIQQNIVVVFDDSTSMMARFGDTSRMISAKKALATVVETFQSNTNIGIVTLNGKQNEKQERWDEANWCSPFDKLDVPTVIRNLNQIQPHGNTPLGACMKVGTDVLLAKRAKQKYGIYRLLIITDGEASDPDLVERYLPDIMSRNIYVDVIGVGMKGTHALANRVSSYKKANDPEQLATALQTSLAEVSYEDANAADKDFKMLEGLPDGVSVKIIEALSDFENQPIGEKQTSSSPATSPSTGTSVWVWVLVAIVSVVVILLFCFLLRYLEL
jgi:hypothetical protein